MDSKDVIRTERIKHGWTMKQFADKVGVSEGTVSRWESGEIANMRRDKIVLISKLFDISPAVLMGWDIPDQDVSLTKTELSIVIAYRKADDDDRRLVRKVLGVSENQINIPLEDVAI